MARSMEAAAPGFQVTRHERAQRDVIAALGCTVDSERPGKGGHRVLYLTGPAGQKLVVTIQSSYLEGRALKNFRSRLKNSLTACTCSFKVEAPLTTGDCK